MPFMMKVMAEEGYVLVEHEGAVTAEELREAREAMLTAVADHELRGMLIDWRRVSAFPQTADFYFVVSETSPSPLQGARCAIVYAPDTGGLAQFVENCARNRGLRVNVFASRDEAAHWLVP